MAHVELTKRVFLADLANWKTFAGSLQNNEMGTSGTLNHECPLEVEGSYLAT